MEALRKSKEEVKTVSFWAECACEFLCTTVLMCMVALVIVSNDSELYKHNTTHYGFLVLGYVFMVIEAYGPIACVMNPAVCFSLLLAGRMSLLRCFLYIIIELIAGSAGTWMGYILTPTRSRVYKAFRPSKTGMSLAQSVGAEAFFTFNFVFVVLSCHGLDVHRKYPHLPSMAIGFSLALGLWAGGTHTGGLMNPIIALGPAELSGDFQEYWIFWVGPLLGGAMAVPVYLLLVKGKNFELNKSGNRQVHVEAITSELKKPKSQIDPGE